MSSRLFVLTAWYVIVAACAKQPPAQSAALDTSKPAAVDSALTRADKARIQGAESAKVWLVMASDFECPFCKQFHDETYKQILADYVVPGNCLQNGHSK